MSDPCIRATITGNRGGLFALVADRFAQQDRERMAELDRLIAEAGPLKGDAVEPKECEVCGVVYKPKAANGRFCSVPCYRRHRAARRAG